MKKYKGYKRLEFVEFQIIFVMRRAGKKVSEIAKGIGRTVKTVSGALNNYRHPHYKTWLHMSAYEQARYAYDEAQRRKWRSRNKGHIKDARIRIYVIDKLTNAEWSPEQISIRITKDIGKKISTKTIYNFIKKEHPELTSKLREKGKARRQNVVGQRSRFKQGAPEKRGIDERDEAITKRLEVGHWEGDTVVSTKKGGKGGVVRIRERLTRKSISRIVPDLKAETVLSALRGMFHELPSHMRKSLTLDNGSEFAYSVIIKLEKNYTGFKVYYCDAYASWQKGSIENSNKDLRWYYPKGTDFGKVLPLELYWHERKINDRPMKCHGGLTANEVFGNFLKLAA